MSRTSVNINNLPIELLLNICENAYILDDLLSLNSSCKLFNSIIKNYKIQILSKLFLQETFSNSYYNLFFSFINNKYELSKETPYSNFKQLLNWHPEYIKIDNKDIKWSTIQFFINTEKLHNSFIDGNLGLFKNFVHLLFIPSQYIYNSKFLSSKYFNLRGLMNPKTKCNIMIKLCKELNYLNVAMKDRIYTIEETQDSVFKNLLDVYPDIIVNHIINFQKFLHPKHFKQILHNFIINLFLEWLFDNECEFIESIYYKLYLHFPHFIQKTLYRILYNEFEILYDVWTDEFVDQFYIVNRIFLPINKILKLYNTIQLDEYKQFCLNKKIDWKYNLQKLIFI